MTKTTTVASPSILTIMHMTTLDSSDTYDMCGREVFSLLLTLPVRHWPKH